MKPSQCAENGRGFARAIRIETIKMIAAAKASHVASCFSIAEILAAIYDDTNGISVRSDEPDWPDRDRFFLGKGHACAALYATLALRNFFPIDDLQHFGQPESRLLAHASHHVPGVELSSGSLGHALSVACGTAYGLELMQSVSRAFVLLSDGELNEGSTWEALLFAAHHRLQNLTVIVDVNGLQGLGKCSDILALNGLSEALSALGLGVVELDGHSIPALQHALFSEEAIQRTTTTIVLAKTIKGRGVSFMENSLLWHYRSPTDEEFHDALAELNDS